MNQGDRQGGAKDSERFHLLYDSLEHFQERLVTSVTATAGALLVVIGWSATSESLTRTIATSRWLGITGVFVLVAALAVYLGTSYRLLRESRRVHGLLVALAYLEPAYYAQHRISGWLFACGMILNTLLFVMGALVLFQPLWSSSG